MGSDGPLDGASCSVPATVVTMCIDAVVLLSDCDCGFPAASKSWYVSVNVIPFDVDGAQTKLCDDATYGQLVPVIASVTTGTGSAGASAAVAVVRPGAENSVRSCDTSTGWLGAGPVVALVSSDEQA